MTNVERIKQLEEEVRRLHVAFVSMLVWMSQSANTPLNADELQRLVNIAEGTENINE
jgi:hypothetical protein